MPIFTFKDFLWLFVTITCQASLITEDVGKYKWTHKHGWGTSCVIANVVCTVSKQFLHVSYVFLTTVH